MKFDPKNKNRDVVIHFPNGIISQFGIEVDKLKWLKFSFLGAEKRQFIFSPIFSIFCSVYETTTALQMLKWETGETQTEVYLPKVKMFGFL